MRHTCVCVTHTYASPKCVPVTYQTWGHSAHGVAIKQWATLQHTATHCNTLQHTATHCNTQQHTGRSTASALEYTVRTDLSHRLITPCYSMSSHNMTCQTWRIVSYDSPHHITYHKCTLQQTAAHCRTLQHAAALHHHNHINRMTCHMWASHNMTQHIMGLASHHITQQMICMMHRCTCKSINMVWDGYD